MAGNEKPRIFQDGRDMMINVVIIIVAMLAVVGFTGLCTFNPGAPEQGPVQEVDARSFVELESRAVNYPVRYPEMSAGWTTNSARRSMIGGAPAPVIGWVTPGGGFIQMTQTAAPLDDAVREIDADPRELASTEQVGGAQVQIYSSTADDVRDVWAVDVSDARLVFTGAATADEFRELIETAVGTTPISRG
ncbi:DUF4245 domain-containing protein [Corynebacterium sanguinis]|uniref:DUF4245 domain-containing protein n=1 Tax=Corynebacterium sanguinis TaxID=2594913 RepID=UPI0011846C35|nr:DUF4245 domain-containing protein [Corynebacterium sanguinis]QDR78569.1 DUF4245 domain-containing protein [Corynebacterium sanguinis]